MKEGYQQTSNVKESSAKTFCFLPVYCVTYCCLVYLLWLIIVGIVVLANITILFHFISCLSNVYMSFIQQFVHIIQCDTNINVDTFIHQLSLQQ